jgi:WD40 repeat protein/serine/threonine protein kinase
MTDQPASEKAIFQAALDIASPEERAAYLDQACGGDLQLRAGVAALLAAHDRLHGADAPPTLDDTKERPGTLVGPYKLLQPIGEGGMGAVFMAEQTEPVQRKVALKIIKPGMDSAQVVARFEAERQALALMDHPNIARVFDGGTTDSGRPYFVMEVVKGVAITKYCDERRLTLKERLGLFIPVCQAVQHAHQKGIIHRDLKPSNVLVAQYDSKPVPKVIDFGVAKATGPKLTERTLFTEFGAVVGTLEYMSPEQAELNQLDIDTRSDIYTLGVLLYELLTGTTPLDRKRLKDTSLPEVLRIIREEEPPRPSTRLSTTVELPAIAANRGLEARKLRGLVRGELDWIVMKCLEKERDRRYETANGLARDIERYLNDEPVYAGPPSAGYRLRKFLRRHRTAVLAAATVFFLLVAGVIGTSAGLVWALNAEEQADQSLKKEKAANIEKDQTLGQLRAQEQQTRIASNFYRLALADREWWLNNVGEAELVLDGCPEDLRPWEWHYLKRRCHAELVNLRLSTDDRGDSVPAAFSPDFQRIALAFSSGQVIVRDLSDGKVVFRAAQKAGVVMSLAFSPDAKKLAVAGLNLDLWDLTSGTNLLTWNDRAAPINYVAFSADSRFLAVGGKDRAVRVWDTAGAKELVVFREHKNEVNGLGFSPDGRHVVSNSRGQELVWQRETGRVVLTPPGFYQFFHGAAPLRSCFSPDGRLFAAGDRTGVTRAWSLETGEVVQTFRGHRNVDTIMGVAFDFEGRRLATADNVGIVCLHEVATGNVILSVSARTDPALAPVGVSQVAFSPDGKGLALACADRTVKVWNLSSWQSRILRGATDAVSSIVYSSDGTRLAGLGPKAVHVWDLTTGQEARTLRLPVLAFEAMAFSADGKQLATAGTHQPVAVWDTTTGRPARTYSEQTSWTHELEFTRDGGLSLLSCDSTGVGKEIRWQLVRRTLPEDQRTVAVEAGPVKPVTVAASPDGRRLAAAFIRERVKVWTLPGGNDPLTIPDTDKAVYHALAFSPDGRLLIGTILAGSGAKLSGEIIIWDADTGKELNRLKGHTGIITQVAFSPDGALLASASIDQTVRLWNVAAGTEVRCLQAHTEAVYAVAFSPDGRRLVSGSNDRTLKLWETATGREVLTLRGHTYLVNRVLFSPDGARIASYSLDGTVKVWDGSPYNGKSGPIQFAEDEKEAGPREGGR